MLRAGKCILLIVAFINMTACRESFEPALVANVVNLLVVEGFITTNGSTQIQLSRTQKLKEKGSIKAELKAKVQIENDNGATFSLTDNNDGSYTSAELNLPSDRKYRLRITTTDGKAYVSDFAIANSTPENKINWTKDPDGVRLTVSTGDEKNQTKYYRWTYEETWAIQSVRPSEFVAKQTRPYVSVEQRNIAEISKLFNCWGSERSPIVLIKSTAALSRDIVTDFPLSFIPNGSDKLAIKYSMLLKQYALTREAYDFFQLMKKNTEEMGQLFDPQPSMERGNINCISNPDEPVIGYVVVSSSVEKRLFITSEEAGNWKSSLKCPEIVVSAHRDSLNKYFMDDAYLITYGVLGTGYGASIPICVDCRFRGSSIKPSFW